LKRDLDIVHQLDASEEHLQRNRLRTMQGLALALLAIAALAFALAHSQRDGHPAWGYLEAFAEAAMVGALADWFAVVALFRHPLGVPVWHTAIIPNSKDEIGRNLGTFVENHFITEDGIARRVRQADIAMRAGEWLINPSHARQLSKAVSGALQNILSMADNGELRGMVREFATAELARVDLSSLAGGCLDALITEGKPQLLVDRLLDRAAVWLDDPDNHPTLGDFILESFAIDSAMVKSGIRLYMPKAIVSLREQVVEIRMNPAHPLRERIGEWLGDAVLRLKADPSWQASIAGYQSQVIRSDKVQDLLGGISDTLRERLAADLRSERPALAAALQGLVERTGRVLLDDATVRGLLNEAIETGSALLVRRYRGEAGRFIEQQLAQWTSEEMSTRIELAIGRDLQFIRINGTIVGGLAGLLIHTITVLI
jgi:uncharacterized membrane-anchored protein YjiN (DUF445 family)